MDNYIMRQANGKEVWATSFGDQYTDRNQVKWLDRIGLWKAVMVATQARSVCEFGCNAGWNLSAIRRLYPDVLTWGIDINRRACEQAWSAGFADSVLNADSLDAVPGKQELVFTAGVLIHIEPDILQGIMQSIIDKSYRWVVAIEYESDEEVQLMYRGQPELLWRRPFGKLYESLGLKLFDSGPAGPGFDQCTCWVMEKV